MPLPAALISIATFLQLATAASLPDAESGLQNVNQDKRRPDSVILTDTCLHPKEKMILLEKRAKKKSPKPLSLIPKNPRNDELVVEARVPFGEEAAVVGEVLNDEGVVVGAGVGAGAEVEEEAQAADEATDEGETLAL